MALMPVLASPVFRGSHSLLTLLTSACACWLPLFVMLPLLEPATPPTKPLRAVMILPVLSLVPTVLPVISPRLRPTIPPIWAALFILVAASWLAPTLEAPCTFSSI